MLWGSVILLSVGLWWAKYKMRIAEITSSPQPSKPLTPQKARVKSLQQNVERSKQQLQRERERQRQQREAERRRRLSQQGITV